MKRIPLFLRLWSLTIVILFMTQAVQAAPIWHVKDDYPDFNQNDSSLSQGGKYHCSPTSAANSLTWMEKKLGLDIVSDANTDTPTSPNNHVGLIRDLGTAMNTNVGGNGTWNDDMVKGYRNYLRGPNNKSGRDFDVKFVGTKYFQGYTIGQVSANVDTAWLKSELTQDEDVTLTIDWYLETSPGVLSGPKGAHTVSMNGYFSDGSLSISDPGYAELLVEPDADFPGQNVYSWSTGSDSRLRGKIVGGISVSPKAPYYRTGRLDLPPDKYPVTPWTYPVTPRNPAYDTGVVTCYADYAAIGLNETALTMPLLDGAYGQISILQQGLETGYNLTYDQTGLLAVTQIGEMGEILPYDNSLGFFQLTAGFFPSPEMPQPHVQVEMFIDRSVFGDLMVDSFFDVFTSAFDPMGNMIGLGGGLGNLVIPAQQVNIVPLAGGGIPDIDNNGIPDYEQYPELMPSFDPIVLAAEQAAYEAALATTPEPSALALAAFGLAGLSLIVHRRKR